jgi:RimJ/RimL family protein N-acetyltransferase
VNAIIPDVELAGSFIRLVPLRADHVDGLLAAAAEGREHYRWSFVPADRSEFERYVATALEWREAKTSVPFVIVRTKDSAVIGSTRFFELQRWNWPADHPRAASALPDVGEIGYTWLSASAMRTPANTQAKLLLLTHAFEAWNVLRICFHTDERNERSRAALERIGARFEGLLRSHRIAADATPRNSCRYSILASEWPDVKERLVSYTTTSRPR